jgi:hypothetical protein
MANLLGEPFREYVNDQIKVRQEVHGKKNRTTDELKYLNTRNAWIKMASSVSIDEDRLKLLKNGGSNELLNGIYEGKNLALKNVLFGGLSSFGKIFKNKTDKEIEVFEKQYRSGIEGDRYKRAYGVGGTSQFGYSPMPGIIDMEIKCLNRGSVKKMTLNIKCHNKAQFDVIDVLYLRLGYSVFVEWGYDKYLDNKGNLKNMGSTLIDREFWLDQYDQSDYSKWLPVIENQRNKTSGNYDGAFGVISNFSWTFEQDGTYNVRVDITSLGDIIESLKVNLPSVYLSKGNAFYARKFARLLEEAEGDTSQDQDPFYKWMFPGLKESIENWYDSIIDGTFQPTSYVKVENIPQRSYDDYKFGNNLDFKSDIYNYASDTLGEDHIFYDPDNPGTEFTNKKILDIVGDDPEVVDQYKMSQESIRKAVEFAIIQWFSDDFECFKDQKYDIKDNKGAELYSLHPQNSRIFQQTKNIFDIKSTSIQGSSLFAPDSTFKYSLPILGYTAGNPVAISGTYANARMYVTYDPSNFGLDQQIKIAVINNLILADALQVNPSGEKIVNIQALADEIGLTIPTQSVLRASGIGSEVNQMFNQLQISSPLNTRLAYKVMFEYAKTNGTTQDLWWMILKKEVPKELLKNTPILQTSNKLSSWDGRSDRFNNNLSTPGVPKEYIIDYVFNYFAKNNVSGLGETRDVVVPVSEESRLIEELEKKQKLAQEDTDKEFTEKQQAELDKAKSARAQQISDFKNQNKNRIYRFFYDIRKTIKGISQRDGLSVTEGGKVMVPEQGNWGWWVGKYYFYTEDESFYKNNARITQLNFAISNTETKLSSLEGYKGVFEGKAYGFGMNSSPEVAAYYNKMGANYKSEKEKIIQNNIDNKAELKELIAETEAFTKQSMNSKNIIMMDKLSPVDNQGFIRLGAFLDWVNQKLIPKIFNNDVPQPLISIDTNINQNVCYVIDNVFSLDIRKMIVNNNYFINGLTDINDASTANITKLWPHIDQFVMSMDGGNIKYGQIMNIYFSFARLQEIFDTTVDRADVYLFGVLKDICNDINECLGNINNIEPVVDENNIIHFIEQTSIPGIEEIAKKIGLEKVFAKENEKLIVFGNEPTTDKSNFVRNIGLTTEISKEYATMITIGATANGSIPGVEATAFSRWNVGIKDRFKNNITDATETENLAPISSSAGQEIQNNYATLLKESVGAKEGYGLFGLSTEKKREYQINSEDIEYNAGIIQDFYKLMQSQNSYIDEKDKEGNTIESSVGFLPFNLKLELDGISGMKIYNKMDIQQRFLPSNYPESLEFIITQVNHKLQNNDWVTSLETIATSKSVLTNKSKKPTPKK